jgi:hypothetical protein
VVGAPSNFHPRPYRARSGARCVLADPGILEAQILGTLGAAAVRGLTIIPAASRRLVICARYAITPRRLVWAGERATIMICLR